MASVQTVRLPDGSTRYVVPYDDFDGISLLGSRDALLARYREHDARSAPSVADDPTATLLMLANANEAVAWGTHQTDPHLAVISLTPFDAEEREENGVRSSLAVGCLTLTGELYVGGWHSLTYGCDYQHGELDCPRIALPAGRYRVIVHRPFSATEERADEDGAPTVFLVHLERVDDAEPCAPLSEVPGADGWF